MCSISNTGAKAYGEGYLVSKKYAILFLNYSKHTQGEI
jgi:hypothetical protein